MDILGSRLLIRLIFYLQAILLSAARVHYPFQLELRFGMVQVPPRREGTEREREYQVQSTPNGEIIINIILNES